MAGIDANFGGVQVVQLDNGSYILDLTKLEEILKNERVKDLPVVVVSVAGAYRGGKSFLLNFILRYLKSPKTSQIDGSWINNEWSVSEGFSWRAGTKTNTTGIVMWHEPIIISVPAVGDVAVILMDTQGAFDGKSTNKDCSTIFALSTMLSSIQIYNLSKLIREVDLQHLQLFTEYGMCARTSSEDTAFQTLLFLVRDWGHLDSHPFGSSGGESYIKNDILKIKSDHHKELKKLRNHIMGSFSNVSGFLLPHPGSGYEEIEFKGLNEELETIFVEYVRDLVSYIFNPKTMTPKEIAGRRVKTGELFEYFKDYMVVFNSKELPSVQSIMETTAERGLRSAYEESRQLYEMLMKRDCSLNVPAKDLKLLHERHSATAIKCFTDRKKIDAKNEGDYLKQLKEEIKNRLREYGETNYSKLQTLITSAKAKYTEIIPENNGADKMLCLHILDMQNIHEEALQAALQFFDNNRRLFSREKDTERDGLKQEIENKFDSYNRLNIQNNMTIVSEIRLEYWNTMLAKYSGNNRPSEAELNRAHEEVRSEAMANFSSKRNRPDSHSEDEYKTELYELINTSFKALKQILESKNRLALEAAVKSYDDYIDSAWNHKKVCLHPADLEKEHTEGEWQAFFTFRPGKVSSGKVVTENADEDILRKIIKDRFKKIKDINDASNETAIEQALEVYKSEMEEKCGQRLSWYLTVGVSYVCNVWNRKTYHEESKEKAMSIFKEKRREYKSNAADPFLEKLEKDIAKVWSTY